MEVAKRQKEFRAVGRLRSHRRRLRLRLPPRLRFPHSPQATVPPFECLPCADPSRCDDRRCPIQSYADLRCPPFNRRPSPRNTHTPPPIPATHPHLPQLIKSWKKRWFVLQDKPSLALATYPDVWQLRHHFRPRTPTHPPTQPPHLLTHPLTYSRTDPRSHVTGQPHHHVLSHPGAGCLRTPAARLLSDHQGQVRLGLKALISTIISDLGNVAGQTRNRSSPPAIGLLPHVLLLGHRCQQVLMVLGAVDPLLNLKTCLAGPAYLMAAHRFEVEGRTHPHL